MEKDVSGISNALKQEDLVGRVIRVQIHIETLINDCLSIMVLKKEHLNSMNLDFFGKTQLSLALGLPEDFKKPINFIGKIRNKFAHNLNFSLDNGLMNNFYSTFSDDHKAQINETASMESLSWISKGQSWKSVTADEKFMIFGMSLYYLPKIAIREISRTIKLNKLKINVVNLSHRLVAAEEFSGLEPMVPWLFSPGPDRLGGSLK